MSRLECYHAFRKANTGLSRPQLTEAWNEYKAGGNVERWVAERSGGSSSGSPLPVMGPSQAYMSSALQQSGFGMNGPYVTAPYYQGGSGSTSSGVKLPLEVKDTDKKTVRDWMSLLWSETGTRYGGSAMNLIPRWDPLDHKTLQKNERVDFNRFKRILDRGVSFSQVDNLIPPTDNKFVQRDGGSGLILMPAAMAEAEKQKFELEQQRLQQRQGGNCGYGNYPYGMPEMGMGMGYPPMQPDMGMMGPYSGGRRLSSGHARGTQCRVPEADYPTGQYTHKFVECENTANLCRPGQPCFTDDPNYNTWAANQEARMGSTRRTSSARRSYSRLGGQGQGQLQGPDVMYGYTDPFSGGMGEKNSLVQQRFGGYGYGGEEMMMPPMQMPPMQMPPQQMYNPNPMNMGMGMGMPPMQMPYAPQRFM